MDIMICWPSIRHSHTLKKRLPATIESIYGHARRRGGEAEFEDWDFALITVPFGKHAWLGRALNEWYSASRY